MLGLGLVLGVAGPLGPPQPAYAGIGNVVCTIEGAGWLTMSGLLHLGFTGNAIANGLRTPPHPGSGSALLQLGVMVPHVALSVVLWSTLGTRCDDRILGALYYGVPLVWSLALIGHGAWSLHASNQEAAALGAAMPALSIRVPLDAHSR